MPDQPYREAKTQLLIALRETLPKTDALRVRIDALLDRDAAANWSSMLDRVLAKYRDDEQEFQELVTLCAKRLQ